MQQFPRDNQVRGQVQFGAGGIIEEEFKDDQQMPQYDVNTMRSMLHANDRPYHDNFVEPNAICRGCNNNEAGTIFIECGHTICLVCDTYPQDKCYVCNLDIIERRAIMKVAVRVNQPRVY